MHRAGELLEPPAPVGFDGEQSSDSFDAVALVRAGRAVRVFAPKVVSDLPEEDERELLGLELIGRSAPERRGQ